MRIVIVSKQVPYFLVGLLLLISSTVQATPLVFSRLGTGSPASANTSGGQTPDPSVPRSIAVEVGTFDNKEVSLMVPNLLPDPSERIISYQEGDGLERTWTITESNAAEFDLDWNAFEQALLGDHTRRLFVSFRTGNFNRPLGVDYLEIGDRLVQFDMEKIEVDLDYWFWHPVFSTLRQHRIEARIFGEGTIVPEPSAAILAGLGLMQCGRRRKAIRAERHSLTRDL